MKSPFFVPGHDCMKEDMTASWLRRGVLFRYEGEYNQRHLKVSRLNWAMREGGWQSKRRREERGDRARRRRHHPGGKDQDSTQENQERAKRAKKTKREHGLAEMAEF